MVSYSHTNGGSVDDYICVFLANQPNNIIKILFIFSLKKKICREKGTDEKKFLFIFIFRSLVFELYLFYWIKYKYKS